MDRELRISRCKLLYTKWISQVLQNSTGNYTQDPKINHMENNVLKKKCVCVSHLVVSDSLGPPQTVAPQAPLSMGFSK